VIRPMLKSCPGATFMNCAWRCVGVTFASRVRSGEGVCVVGSGCLAVGKKW
jgi:hypothetical protein